MKRLLIVTGAASVSVALAAQIPSRVDFRRDVQPIFQEHCISCHGPSQQMNGLRLDRRREAIRPGGSGTLIGPGNSEGSRLYLRLIGSQYGLQMPPTGPLSPDEINTIKTWIDQGAEWPDELSGEKPLTPPEARAMRLAESLRSGDRRTFERLVREDPQSSTARGLAGSSPLMFAALYGDSASMRLLLANGADPGLKNDGGATALMWAADDLERTQLLLATAGSDPNTRSDEGLTSLTMAARWQSGAVIESLLDHGARVSAGSSGTPGSFDRLEPSDPGILQALFKRGIDPASMPGGVLTAAILRDCDGCVELLASSASRDRLNAALLYAAQFGKTRAIATLVDRGADVNIRGTIGLIRGLTPLLLASASEAVPVDAVRTLIRRGADVKAKSLAGETALDLAKRHGHTRIVDLLIEAGVKETGGSGVTAPASARAGSVKLAIERSIPLLQRTDVTFVRKSGCVSCHNNSLTAMAVAEARKHGIHVDEAIAQQQVQKTAAYLDTSRELFLEGGGVPGGYDTTVYLLAGLAAEKYPPDFATDAAARSIKNQQSPDGRWPIRSARPPIESSDFQVTANALRALQVYAPPGQRSAYEPAIQRAARWLAHAEPKTTEDRAFQLLGLAGASGYQDAIRRAARTLLAEQRADGGWAQLPTLTSDAYATGEALYALNRAAGLPPNDTAYKRGVAFLLNTQFEDGSWYVKSRTLPLQPYFESDFPWGHDQFISAAATNWAVIALAPAVK